MNIQKSIALLALVSGTAVALADDAMKVIKERVALFNHAMLKKDAAWFDKVSTKNYVEFDAKGKKSDRAKAMSEMKQMFAMSTITKINTDIVSAVEKGGAINTTLHSKMVGRLTASKDPNKGILTGDVTYSMHWVKEDGMWKVSWMQTVKEVDTLDGTTIPSGM